MQGQGAVDEIEGRLRQRKLLDVRQNISDRGVTRLPAGPGQHVLRPIDAEHTGCAHLSRPTGKRTESAPKVEHTRTLQRWEHAPQRWPFRCASETLA